MCKRTLSALLALGVIALGARPAVAQESDAELVRRVQELQTLVEQAQRDVQDAHGEQVVAALDRQRGRTETVQVGPIRILALVEQADLAAELFEEVWREDFSAVTGSPSLERSVFTFEWWGTGKPAELYWGTATPGADQRDIRRVEVARVWVPTRDGVRTAVRHALWTALREDFPNDSPMRAWLYESGYASAAETYRELATQWPGVSRACLGGESAACTIALGLVPPSPDVLNTWFSLYDLQQAVVAASYPWAGDIDRDSPSARACVDAGVRAACLSVVSGLRSIGGSTAPEAHILLLWHAVRLGGEGAWARAIESQSPIPAEVLARASGRSVAELVEDWLVELAAQRPATYAGLGRSGLTALFWLLALTAFAMRSTRWRLG
jgi:hypothetical protein